MRGLLLLAILSRGGGHFPGGAANPSVSTAQYAVEGHLVGEPITDHTTTVQFTVSAQGAHWLDGSTFDVGGGCCFEQTHYDRPKLERCGFDGSKTCRAVFEVPYRLSGAGQATGTLNFSSCDASGCTARRVAVSVPYRTRD